MSTEPPPVHDTSPYIAASVDSDRRLPVPASRRMPRRRRRLGPRLVSVLGRCGFLTLTAASALAFRHPLVPVGFGLSVTPIGVTLVVLDAPLGWLHRSGQWLVYSVLLTTTVASCAVGGYWELVGATALIPEAIASGLPTWAARACGVPSPTPAWC